MYCNTHCCHHCTICHPWAMPAPMHWCAVCRRYTYTWHSHQAFFPQPIYVRQQPHHGAAVLRDQQAINALAGGPRRSA